MTSDPTITPPSNALLKDGAEVGQKLLADVAAAAPHPSNPPLKDGAETGQKLLADVAAKLGVRDTTIIKASDGDSSAVLPSLPRTTRGSQSR